MATTSIWSVKGWLGKVVVYVGNPSKTDNPKFFEKQDMTDREMQGLPMLFDAPETVDNAQALLSHNPRFAVVGDFSGYIAVIVLP